MRENEKINIENVGFDLKDELYWKNYPYCSLDNKPMEILSSRKFENYVPGQVTTYGYEIVYRCLHCFHIETERDGT